MVHARCAVLGGLSTTANRNVPPLRHGEVHRLAAEFPKLGFSLNGGVETVDDALARPPAGSCGRDDGTRGVSQPGDFSGRRPPDAHGENSDVVCSNRDPRFEHTRRRSWPDDGFATSATSVVVPAPRDGEARFLRSRETLFALDSDGKNPPCVTRRDVLRRFAVYGDAVLKRKLEEMRKHPKALGEARALAKAVGGSDARRAGGRDVQAPNGTRAGAVDRAAAVRRARGVALARGAGGRASRTGRRGRGGHGDAHARAAGVGAAAARGRARRDARRDARGRLEAVETPETLGETQTDAREGS